VTGPALDSSSLRDSQAEALPERPITAPAQLADISYGRRQVTVRKRDDHPRGARGKSRTERVVDLHDPRTLDAVSRYVMHERPLQAPSPFVFLVGGAGARRLEPLG
jgi:integrase/recombinase XerD